jgi:hypothetical protein
MEYVQKNMERFALWIYDDFVTPDFGLNVREVEHSHKIVEHFALQTLDYV